MNIPLKIIAIYKKGNTPLVKYQETANSTCARQIFKLFFEMLSVISGKMYAEMIDAMVEKADQYDEIVAKKLTNQQDMAVDSNGTYYTTIKDAVENALDGSTVTIIATGTSLSLPDDLYADKNITLDLNGHSLGDDGSYGNNLITRNCNLTIKDSKGGDAIRLEVLADSTVEFRGDVTTTCTYLEYKEGQIKFYGGNIREISYVTLNYADLLPAGYCFYNYSGSTQGAAIELAAFEDEVLIPLAVAECSHPEAKNGKCLYCNATLLVKDNKDTTYSTLPLRRFS